MAPELLDPHDEIYNSKASDIYAYACVCYEVPLCFSVSSTGNNEHIILA